MKASRLNYTLLLVLGALISTLYGCSTLEQGGCSNSKASTQACPPVNAIEDPVISRIHDSRTWVDTKDWELSSVQLGSITKIPINDAIAKIIGPTYDESVRSLATKLWLIEQAQYTVDAAYYIFAKDKVGYAVLGALCDAVQRGVDVRLLVDALGSLRPLHTELKALKRCEDEAGYVKTMDGHLSTRRARVQIVIFNALTNFEFNRRSHDKLLIIDGRFPDQAVVMTGGRNISLDYYGIKEDGSADPTAFRDTEVLLKPANTSTSPTLGDVAEAYFNLLFMYEGNRLIEVSPYHDKMVSKHAALAYPQEQKKAREALAFIKHQPDIANAYQKMDLFTNQDLVQSRVRLAHQLSNLTSNEVATQRLENVRENPNSIAYQITSLIEKFNDEGLLKGTIKVISPYFFISYYKDADEQLVYDGAQKVRMLLEQNPELTIEIVTNSVMTSDNFMTQAIIDIDMIPRLLLDDATRAQWQTLSDDEEWQSQFTRNEQWRKQINHPRLHVYQVGRLDSVQLGGDEYYGKLHAKFLFGNSIGFIGTSNFDYRSNLYNNEVGFVYQSPALSAQLDQVFDELKATGYLWGSPEWLEMRHRLRKTDGVKSVYARTQRTVSDTLHFLGIEYLM